jgi:putative membrane protein
MNLERVNSTPARWWSLLGLALVPLLVAGGFLAAGLNSDTRLHTVKAAVVNLDDPVTIDGKYIPLGRQLTANLVDSARVENLAWTLDSESNARAGLATGAYAAMVIIPQDFSAAATSYAKDAGDAERATIQLSTSPVAGVADATLGKAVALAATNSLNETLTSGYLDKIYVGFNDLGDQFTTMADGSGQLADGLGIMKSKTSTLPASTAQLADGTGKYVSGVNKLVDSTITALPQQVALASGVNQLSQGASGLSGGLKTYQSAMSDLGSNTIAVGQATAAAKAAGSAIPCPDALKTGDAATDARICAAFAAGLDTGATVGAATGVTVGGKAAAAGLDTKDATTGQSLLSGMDGLAGGLSTLNKQLAAAVPNVATTTKDLKKLKAGGTALAQGTNQLADGMPALTDGIAQSADGARKMADGIAQGKDKMPSYSSAERKTLSEVVAAPISTEGLQGLADPNVGWVSLLLVLALWLGALATYVVLKPIARGLLGSADSTAKLIGEALAPGLAVLATQAVALSALAHLGLALSWPKTFEVTGVLLLASVAFAVINHALVTWAGGFGRLVSVVFAIVTTASTVVAAAPGVLTALRPFSPMTAVLDTVRAVITESGGATVGIYGIVGWLLIGLLASSVGVARQRTTNLAEVLAL